MEARFRELLTEAMSIAEEYRADFGGPMKPPPAVTSFRFKAATKGKWDGDAGVWGEFDKLMSKRTEGVLPAE